MAWTELDPNIWTYEKEGDSVEGVYINADTEPESSNSFSNKYYLQRIDGSIVMVWGTKIIDERMKLLNTGTQVKIEFKGQTKNKKGQPLNLFKVYFKNKESGGQNENTGQ